MKKISAPISIICSCLFTVDIASAQIIPDTTLNSENSTIIRNTDINNLPSDLIRGGATRGSLLFHSFREFNVKSDRGAYFDNPSGINTILTRVTGGNQSNLLGKLGVLGNADFLFINPSGILFGPNSSLDLNGSFLSTTAGSVIFDNGNIFDADDPKSVPNLKISTPIGLLFGESSQPIISQSRALGTSGFSTGLELNPGKTFAAIGGDLNIQGGIIRSPGGNIELGSVGPKSLVRLHSTAKGWKISYQDVKSFQDIKISQRLNKRSSISTSPLTGGRINVAGNNLILSDGSQILANDADIRIDITNRLKVSGFSEIFIPNLGVIKIPSSIANETVGKLNGKSTIINAKKILLQDRGRISTASTGVFTSATGEIVIAEGRGGDIVINASDSVEIINDGSGLFSRSNSFGMAGDIRIDTKRLTLKDGAKISASSSGKNFLGIEFPTGPGGNIQIRSSGSILLSGVSSQSNESSGLFTTSEASANGPSGAIEVSAGSLSLSSGAVISTRTQSNSNGGDIDIDSNSLALTRGGQILTSTFGAGDAGDILLKVTDRINLEGSDPTFIQRFNQLKRLNSLREVRLMLDSIDSASGIFANSELGSTGKAGSIVIDPQTFTIQDGAQISVNNQGTKAAGDIRLQANNLTLDRGTITAISRSNTGGNIVLSIDNLLLRNNSQISTTAAGDGTGGNIDINADTIVAFSAENSDITANAFNGEGGRITINTQGIFGLEVRDKLTELSDITAFSQNNPRLNGIVEINNPEVDPSENLSEQPEAVDPPQEIAQGCRPGQALGGSSFIHVGRGGLPTSPYEAQTATNIWQDLRAHKLQSPTATAVPSSTSVVTPPSPKIMEAKGWIKDSQGRIHLTAKKHQLNDSPLTATTICSSKISN